MVQSSSESGFNWMVVSHQVSDGKLFDWQTGCILNVLILRMRCFFFSPSLVLSLFPSISPVLSFCAIKWCMFKLTRTERKTPDAQSSTHNLTVFSIRCCLVWLFSVCNSLNWHTTDGLTHQLCEFINSYILQPYKIIITFILCVILFHQFNSFARSFARMESPSCASVMLKHFVCNSDIMRIEKAWNWCENEVEAREVRWKRWRGDGWFEWKMLENKKKKLNANIINQVIS